MHINLTIQKKTLAIFVIILLLLPLPSANPLLYNIKCYPSSYNLSHNSYSAVIRVVRLDSEREEANDKNQVLYF